MLPEGKYLCVIAIICAYKQGATMDYDSLLRAHMLYILPGGKMNLPVHILLSQDEPKYSGFWGGKIQMLPFSQIRI